MYRSGVRKVSEILRHTNAFVAQELYPGASLPEESRRRFYPTRKDIANLLVKSRREGRSSTIDQENILCLVNSWKENNPEINVCCRLSTCEDDALHPQNFMYCYQTHWQKRLLKIYGNQITLLDATYRTTRYALPFFFFVFLQMCAMS